MTAAWSCFAEWCLVVGVLIVIGGLLYRLGHDDVDW